LGKSKGGNTVDKVWNIVEPIARELGLMIWDIRYVKEGASWFLRIFIDKEDAVTIEDCERLSKAIDQPLDDADPVCESYYLEVSSPGLGRELSRSEHFELLEGEEIRIKLIRPVDNVKELTGLLAGYADGIITINKDGHLISIKKSDCSKISLNDDKYIGGF